MLSRAQMERRASLRVAADVNARILCDGEVVEHRLIELSCTGARLCRAAGRGRQGGLPLVCAIAVELDEGAPMLLRARTVWTEGALAGIHFIRSSSIGGHDVDRLEIAERIDEMMQTR